MLLGCHSLCYCSNPIASKMGLKVGTRKREMRNGKWGNGKKIHYISLSKLLMFCYCSHQMWWESQCPCMHSLRDQFCLTVGTKGVYMQHNLQANSKYKKLEFFTYGSLLAFLKFVESVNCSYFPTLYKESCFFMHLHCYGYTYICLTYSTII